jgi:hypothetical protein
LLQAVSQDFAQLQDALESACAQVNEGLTAVEQFVAAQKARASRAGRRTSSEHEVRLQLEVEESQTATP